MQTTEILLVEDNPNDAEMTIEVLRSHAITDQITIVRDGEEALDFLFSREAFAHRDNRLLPRLILLDIKMPKVSGLEVLQQIRRDPRTQHIPVVILSSSREDRDITQGIMYGANSYIVKPVDIDQFSETIRLLGTYWITYNQVSPAQSPQ